MVKHCCDENPWYKPNIWPWVLSGFEVRQKRILVTFLALFWSPAAVVVVVIDWRPLTERVIPHDARADIVTLLCLLVSIQNIIYLGVHNQRPVHRVQVAELWVLFNPHGSTGDVPQVVQAYVLQAGHLIDHQGVVVEKILSTYDTQVGEENAKGVQARDAKQEQVVGDDGQLWEAEGAEDILVDVARLLVD